MTHRFVVGPDLVLSREQSRQIATVLRLAPGEVVTLLHDGEELDYRLERIAPAGVVGAVIARRPSDTEPSVALTLAVPLLRGEHTELVIESATQLGVSRFVPFTSARSVVRELGEAKRARWERIAREAVETSGRARLPIIEAVRAWDSLFDALSAPIYVAWEEERAVTLATALDRAAARATLVIGPEGGLALEEVAHARSSGAAIVSLGPRPLRAETAAIAAVSVAMALLERDDPARL